MSFRLVPKSVILNDLEWRNAVILRCFTEIVYDVVVKQLPWFQNRSMTIVIRSAKLSSNYLGETNSDNSV